MARGGARSGTIGKNYQNRTDLHGTQAPKAASGGEYGQVKALLDAQKAVPLPNANQPAARQSAPVAAAPPQGPAQPTVAPGDLNFDGPSERPNEPVTAGLPMGPGPGPEALNIPSQASNVAMQLRTMYANIPAAQNPDMLRLVELAEQQAWK